MKWTLPILLVAVLPLRAAAQDQDPVAQGAAVYGAMCGRCHPARSPLERDDREWVTILLHMRARANLSGSQVRSVLAFLQATNAESVGGEPAPIPDLAAFSTRPLDRSPERIAAGRDIVAARACVGCHMVAGQGGNVGPPLRGTVTRRGIGFVRLKLANPSFNNAATMMPRFGLTMEEIDAVVAYLETLGRAP